jgi:hypothetical protein
MEIKIIPRVAYYVLPERRKFKLQVSDISSQSWVNTEDQKASNKIIKCNMDPVVSSESQKQLNVFILFNQCAAAVNFDFCSFNLT